ncbi:PadR family transcriptional regulator [Asticcacaulis sp.]|uniref:PadR family transcriptional regulator n=1 Tax=Asticcacaulis sp. TaxID=1872648 RepID=UPI002CB79BB5|nr:PadR family transcriptional regulator [Asticcacaulis sp.]HTM80480.1 PadR family transcriptional regulator [Asticcacaulis sp.]
MPAILTTLGFALLGLIRAEPRTGYALRMVFETTPMGSYSSSPGSIYPALKSLEKQGLIAAQAIGKRVLHITPEGRRKFDDWLTAPMGPEESVETALLRFAFLHDHPDRQVTLEFLTTFITVMAGRASGLRNWLAGDEAQAMPLQARLAVMHGLRSLEASAQWASEAYEALKGEV